ncbi:ASCH domain-containing protein [Microbacterium stercoris]|uniref:ASCH domain-containing protein n=1 Tax=Microbacterium stercoris TaxID=2820289 RepID=A0A939QL66_9MICO|nr:ASCH domain-containing protein [Microbacterium stercoris]MBO3663717.1 ASCH domain-containing protein [Microbacterium stercoris]
MTLRSDLEGMRILTVRQPWAWAIIHGGKDVENRVRNIAGDYRGPVAIHAARADAEDAPETVWWDHADWYRARRAQPLRWDPTWSDRGAIIGVVDLVDVLPPSYYDDAEANEAWCSEWAMPGHWQLVLENPRPLAEPIPYRGALGLRRLDDETVARIAEVLA